MANYLLNHQKKIRIRSEKEDQLRRLIARGADETKLYQAAASVKEARLRELKAKIAQVSPLDSPERDETLAGLACRMAKIQVVSLEAILAEFGAS